MTPEEKVLDLLADGLTTEAALRAAMERDGTDTGDLTKILSDFTEQEFAEVTNLNGRTVRREADRILAFDGLTLALTPAGIKRWMLEDAQREEEE